MKQKLDKIRQDLDLALVAVAASNGVTFKVGNMRYSDTEVTITIKALNTEGMTVEEFAKEDWDRNCFLLDLEKEHFGRSFQSNGHRFKVVGLKLSNRMYPVVAETPSGKRYKFKPVDVKRHIGDMLVPQDAA